MNRIFEQLASLQAQINNLNYMLRGLEIIYLLLVFIWFYVVWIE